MNFISDTSDIMEWRLGSSIFTLSPRCGARLTSWDIDLPGGLRRVLFCSDSEEIASTVSSYGGGRILFPFVGRSVYANRPNSWKSPEGQVLSMPYNGFAQNATYRVIGIDNSSSSISMELVASPELNQYYPFKYSMRVHYQFYELGVEIILELHNRDTVSIPWSSGIAFDFSVPWHGGLSQGSYHVHIPAKKIFYQELSGKLVRAKTFAELTDLNDDELVNRIHTRLKSNAVILGPKSDEENILIKIGRDTVPSFFNAIKISKNPQNSLCRTELMMGLPNAPANEQGLYSVLPGSMESFSVFLNLL